MMSNRIEMKLHVLLTVPVALALTACASTAEIRSTTPTATYASAKPAIPVAKCILSKLEPMFRTASVQYRDRETGASVWVEISIYAGKDTAVMMDVDNTPSGSSTVFYSRLLAGESKYRDAITACQA
jgi:hypothetical protein